VLAEDKKRADESRGVMDAGRCAAALSQPDEYLLDHVDAKMRSTVGEDAACNGAIAAAAADLGFD
jgi:hypothetical protein